jgi:hypothetical protein
MEKPLKPMILNGLRGFLLLQTVKVGKKRRVNPPPAWCLFLLKE